MLSRIRVLLPREPLYTLYTPSYYSQSIEQDDGHFYAKESPTRGSSYQSRWRARFKILYYFSLFHTLRIEVAIEGLRP